MNKKTTFLIGISLSIVFTYFITENLEKTPLDDNTSDTIALNESSDVKWIILTSEKKPIDDNRLKKWSSNSLTWDDFAGKIPDQRRNLAYTFTMVDYYYVLESLPMQDCKFVFKDIGTQSLFVTFSSWAVKSGQSESLLNHEQGHFDIAQIHAQNLNKEMVENLLNKEFDCASVALSNDKLTRMEIIGNQMARDIFESIEENWYEMDENYDKETDVGTNNITQLQWDEKINSLLEE